MLLSNGAPQGETKRKSFYEDFKEFTTETTSHGIQYVFNAAYKWVRLIYLVLWLSAVLYTMYIVCISVGKYISMETGTKIEEMVTPRPANLNQPAITHPTVTICPHNIVSKAFLNKNEGLEELFAELHKWEDDSAWNTSASYHKYANWTYHDVMWKGRPRVGLLQCEHYRHECQDLDFTNRSVPEYHWDREYDASNHLHYDWEVSLSGSCYRVNPQGSLFTQVGDYGELKLFFFTDLNDYSQFAKDEAQYGYTVTFSDNGTYSSTMTSGFYMSPGNVYKADMRKYREENIGPPYGRCNPHHKTNVYGTYSLNSCVAQCRDSYVMERCGCVQILPPHPEWNQDGVEMVGCTLRQWMDCGAKAQKEFTDRFVNLYAEEKLCHCSPACMEIWYEATISSSRLSKFYAKKKATDRLPGIISYYNLSAHIDEPYTIDTETVYENLMVLQVIFTSIQESNYKEYIKYDYTQLIGDVGGQMGMLLGASLFTIIEFVHFFVRVAWRYCLRKRGARAAEEQPAYEMHRDQE